MANGVTITGLEQVQRKLRQLVPKAQKAIIKQGFRKALKPVLAEARSDAPVKTGTLKKQLKIKMGKRQRKGEIVMVVVASKKKGSDKDDAFYGWFQDSGSDASRSRSRSTPDARSKAPGLWSVPTRAKLATPRG
jgi:Bacteriophage HK97-gp10, putative tail-component